MKRFLSALLFLVLLLSLGACEKAAPQQAFYYLRTEFTASGPESVVGAELRSITGEQGLNYLLRLYLDGPASETFRSPFPAGLRLLSTKQEPDVLYIYLSGEMSKLKDIDLTLAQACLSRTCFALTEVSQVVIVSTTDAESITYVIDKDQFVYTDELQ